MTAKSRGKLAYVSWVSVFTTLCILAFHVVRGFDTIPGHQFENAEKVEAVGILSSHLHLWIMPIFFCIGGMTAYLAARRRTPREFVGERVRRLGIPFAVGAFTFAPFLFWATEALVRNRSTLGFLDFTLNVHFAQSQPRVSPYVFWTYGNYLWFLGSFFLASLLFAPLGALAHGHWKPDSRFAVGLASARSWLAARTWAILVAFVLPAAAKYLIQPIFPLYTDWGDFTYWSMFYLLGFAMFSSPEIMERIGARWKLFLGLHFAGFATFLGFVVQGAAVRYLSEPGYAPVDVAMVLLSTLVAWTWILGVLGFASRHWLSRAELAGRLQSQATMPFYIFHFPVVMLTAWLMLPLDLSPLPKLMLMLLSAGLLTAGCVWASQKIPGLPFLLGVKEEAHPPPLAVIPNDDNKEERDVQEFKDAG